MPRSYCVVLLWHFPTHAHNEAHKIACQQQTDARTNGGNEASTEHARPGLNFNEQNTYQNMLPVANSRKA
jgi:hypothetical protein